MKRTRNATIFIVMQIAFFCALGNASLKYPAEIGPAIGYLIIEGDSNVENALVFGAHIGTYVSPNVEVELSVFGGKGDIENTDKNADILLPTIELQRYFGEGLWKPYLSGGFGYFQINRDRTIDENKIDFAALYGVGVKRSIAQHFLARFDVRHIINTQSGEGTNNALISAGISWIYGNEDKPKVVAAPPSPPPPSDIDKDGVIDDHDVCPNTPLGMNVDAKGCPLPVDSDSDGITDDLDDCPGTPVGIKVDVHGCPENAKIVPEKEWVLKGVRFESGSDKLTSDSIQGLEEAVEILQTHSKVRVEIQGHTDKTGSAELNQKLSEDRASAVKIYLVGRGISADRLETKGFGFTKPITENRTPKGRAINRRIEFRILSR